MGVTWDLLITGRMKTMMVQRLQERRELVVLEILMELQAGMLQITLRLRITRRLVMMAESGRNSIWMRLTSEYLRV